MPAEPLYNQEDASMETTVPSCKSSNITAPLDCVRQEKDAKEMYSEWKYGENVWADNFQLMSAIRKRQKRAKKQQTQNWHWPLQILDSVSSEVIHVCVPTDIN